MFKGSYLLKPIILGIQPLVFGGVTLSNCCWQEKRLNWQECRITKPCCLAAFHFSVFFWVYSLGLFCIVAKKVVKVLSSGVFSPIFLIEMHRNDGEFLCAERKEWLLWRSAEPCGWWPRFSDGSLAEDWLKNTGKKHMETSDPNTPPISAFVSLIFYLFQALQQTCQ